MSGTWKNHGFYCCFLFSWKRLTYVTGFSKTGTIEGEVTYVTPCGKTVKNHFELIKVCQIYSG